MAEEGNSTKSRRGGGWSLETMAILKQGDTQEGWRLWDCRAKSNEGCGVRSGEKYVADGDCRGGRT
jgi:hypothetical protein